jgi:hypothetical protein
LLGKPILSKEKIEKHSKEELLVDGVIIIKEMMSKDEMNSWVNLFLEKDLTSLKLLRFRNLETVILEVPSEIFRLKIY